MVLKFSDSHSPPMLEVMPQDLNNTESLFIPRPTRPEYPKLSAASLEENVFRSLLVTEPSAETTILLVSLDSIPAATTCCFLGETNSTKGAKSPFLTKNPFIVSGATHLNTRPLAENPS